MRTECIEAVQKAAGRVLKAAEVKDIEDRILGNMRQLAREDRAKWMAMSDAQRMQESAKRASEQLISEAVRKKQMLIQDAKVAADIRSYADDRAQKGDTYLDAIDRKLAPKRDLQGGTTSVALSAKAIYSDLTRNLEGLLDVTGKWWGLFTNKEGVVALVRELHGEDSGVPEAKAAAKAFHEAAESARQQFNSVGGAIGKLEDWAIPQFHDRAAVQKMGRDNWVASIIGKLDREKYVNADGSLMTDAELTRFLGEAWKSIAWDGAQNAIGQPKVSSKVANRGSAHRQIHFKDADSYMAYQAEFGTQDPLQLMFGHFNRLAKDIALVKELGSNPDNMVDQMLKWAKLKDLEAGHDLAKVDSRVNNLRNLYNYIAGKGEPVGSEALKTFGDVMTGLHVASKLGSATISALVDQATVVLASKTANMPVMKIWRNELSAFNLANKEEKAFARRQGLMHEAFTAEVQRWGTDNISQTWAGKMGSFVMKISGLNAFTLAEKRAFGLGMYDLAGGLSRKFDSLAALDPSDRATLERAGVTEADFQIWRKADVTSRNGMNDTVLTPDAVYAVQGVDDAAKREAAQKLIAVGLMDTDVAVPTPTERDRADLYGGIQRGTVKGEMARQIALMKATPYAQMMNHWSRMMDQQGAGNKFKYAAAYLSLTTLMGAFAMELNEILSGKDPKDFAANPVRTGAAALLKGGGLGFFGDFMFSDKTLSGQTGGLAGMLGPSASAAESLVRLTVGNAAKAFQGKETHVASDSAALAKSMIPGINLWYAKAVVNHLWIQNIQEALEPGYGSRMEQRAMKEFGQEFWWRPGDTLPERGPNVGAAFGQR